MPGTYSEAVAGSHISVSGGIALTAHEVERSTALRNNADWLAKAWDDPATRVLVVEDGQVLARIADGLAELVFVSPEQAPDGVRFLLGVDSDGVAYFGAGGSLSAVGSGPDSDGDRSSVAGPAGETARTRACAGPGCARSERC